LAYEMRTGWVWPPAALEVDLRHAEVRLPESPALRGHDLAHQVDDQLCGLARREASVGERPEETGAGEQRPLCLPEGREAAGGLPGVDRSVGIPCISEYLLDIPRSSRKPTLARFQVGK